MSDKNNGALDSNRRGRTMLCTPMTKQQERLKQPGIVRDASIPPKDESRRKALHQASSFAPDLKLFAETTVGNARVDVPEAGEREFFFLYSRRLVCECGNCRTSGRGVLRDRPATSGAAA